MAGENTDMREDQSEPWRWALAELIESKRRGRKDTELAIQAGVGTDGKPIVSDATINGLVNARPASGPPKTTTMKALAVVLPASEREVGICALTAVGMDMAEPQSILVRRLNPRAYVLDKHPLLVDAIHHAVDEMVRMADLIDNPSR